MRHGIESMLFVQNEKSGRLGTSQFSRPLHRLAGWCCSKPGDKAQRYLLGKLALSDRRNLAGRQPPPSCLPNPNLDESGLLGCATRVLGCD
jgi:hypothetical protein